MTQLMVPRKLARELTYCGPLTQFADVDWPEASVLGIARVVENRHTGQEKRWTSIRELVIQTASGAMWRRLYERGLTEYQEGYEPFSGEGPNVPFDRVEAVEVPVIQYRPVKGA